MLIEDTNSGNRGGDLTMELSMTEPGQTAEAINYAGLTESDRDELLKAFGNDGTLDEIADQQTSSKPVQAVPSLPPVNELQSPSSSTRSIPVPPRQSQPNNVLPSSQPNSYGSSGSAFLSSVLNPQGGGGLLASHTPPAASSYEVAHFGKRARAGSVSGKLRMAEDYLEQKGLLDRQTKGILNDLLIMGDEEIQQAMDQYESGDPSMLEEMIQSGSLQNRLPKDIDILGGLGDFDFLTVHDDAAIGEADIGELEAMQSQQQGRKISSKQASKGLSHPGQDIASKGQNQQVLNQYHDDGIGDLDFTGEFSDNNSVTFGQHPSSYDSHQLPQQLQQYGSNPASQQASVSGSPADLQQMTDYERRNRANSLFCALLNAPGEPSQPQPHPGSFGTEASNNTAAQQYGEWMSSSAQQRQDGILVGGPAQNQNNRVPQAPPKSSGIGASLEADKKRKDKEKREEKKREKERKQQERKEKKERKQQEKAEMKKLAAAQAAQEEREEHIPGCGRPRSLSDPNLKTSIVDGLMEVDRPDDWVGAYSPESRKVRLERFMEKRKHRVWQQKVKYDVRKNFADSRLRVKGRFVKKEDELIMRELMSLT